MTKNELRYVFNKVFTMSFEEGKKFIESTCTNFEHFSNYDKHLGLYDEDFIFDDDEELMISFTSSYIQTDDDFVVDYDEGYWSIKDDTALIFENF